MRKFIVKRLLISVLILFLVTVVIYGLMRALPTSYVESVARERAASATGKSYNEWLSELNAAYGLDSNIFVGYGSWISNAIRGNFGESWKWGGAVTDVFSRVIWYSVVLGGVVFILELVIAVPLGIKSAVKQYTKTDYAITVFALMGISLPTFFIATLLKFIFHTKLGWLPLYGIVSRFHETMTPFGKLLDMGMHLILPIVTLTLVSVGSLMRYTRTNMLEVLNSDYIRTARAKGLSEKSVINYHAFRNTLIPIVTIVGGTLPSLFSGALITETLFMIPGIGFTSYESIRAGDIPFTMFYLTFMAVLTLLGTLMSDILYAIVDPRVRVN